MKVLEYSDLEKMYDDFIGRANLEAIPLDDKEYRCHSIFLNEFIGTPIPSKLSQMRKRTTVEVNGKILNINYEKAPKFSEKKDYLEWLFKQIKD